MSTANPSPFASPASQPQPSVANQYPASGVDIVQNNFSGPRRALAAFRNGTAPGGVMAKPSIAPGGGPDSEPGAGAMPVSGATVSDAQTMPVRQTANRISGPQDALRQYMSTGGAPMGGTNARGMGAVAPRSPGVQRPMRGNY